MPKRNTISLLMTPLVIWLSYVSSVAAQTAPVESPLLAARPEAVDMSSEKLALVMPAVEKLIEQGKIPGAIVAVARRGKLVLFESAGWADMDAKLPMKRDSILRFYSMTKPLTSVAAMCLIEEQKLGLDDPVSKYVPEFAGLEVIADAARKDEQRTVGLDREMTIRDLMRHTSGLTYGVFGNTYVDKKYRSVNVLDRNDTLQSLAKKLGNIPLLYQPSTRFNYSVSTDVLGYVVQRVSGQRLSEYLRSKILKPLRMNDTSFFVPSEKATRLANNYGPRVLGKGLRVIDDRGTSRYLAQPKHDSGGGGAVSTAGDYIRFCQMLLGGGELDGIRILKTKSVAEMTRNQLPSGAYPISLGGARDGVGFGLGFSVVVEKTEYTNSSPEGEYGWGGAASTHFWISPDQELAVVALTQHMPYSFLLEATVKPLVYDAVSSQ